MRLKGERRKIKGLWYFVLHVTNVIAMTEEKLKSLVKFCLAYQKSGRVNRCAKIIGRSLAECEATIEDVKVARLLLTILEGEK